MEGDKLIRLDILTSSGEVWSSKSHDALISAAKLHRLFLKKISENPELQEPTVIRNAIRR